MDPDVEWFLVTDYRALNKDFTPEQSDAELIQHWYEIGCHQGRLCNAQQLVMDNEFGCELALYIPYYYYLWCAGLWFDNVVTTYKGMKPFYFFLPSHCVFEVEKRRHWVPGERRLLPLANKCGFKFRLDTRWWRPPPFRDFYQRNNHLDLSTEKPLLVIQNKYNEEFCAGAPLNFFNLTTLSALIERFANAYQIVYLRPCPARLSDSSYSWDHNRDVPYNLDFEWLEEHPEYKVETLESIQACCTNVASYNEVKLWLFAKCENYISVQGGGSLLMPFFARRMLVLHKEGSELASSVYKPGSWFRDQLRERDDNDPSMEFQVVTRDEDVVPTAEALFLIDP